MSGTARIPVTSSLLAVAIVTTPATVTQANVTREDVGQAVRDGVRFLKQAQRADGSWPDYAGGEYRSGMTSLVTLALLTAGEPADSPPIARALGFLQQFTEADLDRTYTVALQTMVFAAADPQKYRVRMAKNVAWLEQAQLKPGDRFKSPGSWTYTGSKAQQGDNSNTQYALLGLDAAAEVGIPVKQEVWDLSRRHWETSQRPDGAWGYIPGAAGSITSAGMTCAGISCLAITSRHGAKIGRSVVFTVNRSPRRLPERRPPTSVGERLVGDAIRCCGEGGVTPGATELETMAKATAELEAMPKVTTDPSLQGGIDWLARRFRVDQNFSDTGVYSTWKYSYLAGLGHAGRLSGQGSFGHRDWYSEGAAELVHAQDRVLGYWRAGTGPEADPHLATSFALLFLTGGGDFEVRTPLILIYKVRHGPDDDWNNDPNDVRNLVEAVSSDWRHPLIWQAIDPAAVTVEDMKRAPILFLNGHEAPTFNDEARRKLREYIVRGGFLFAEACCGEAGFDRGFRALMKEIFPDPEQDLRPLPPEHAIWRSRHRLGSTVHPLWGIEYGGRIAVVYTPADLSCFWNQAEARPDHPSVRQAVRVGQNVVDYATGRKLPVDRSMVPAPAQPDR